MMAYSGAENLQGALPNDALQPAGASSCKHSRGARD